MCGLRHMLSESKAIKDTTQFFSPSVLKFVDMDVKVTNNEHTVNVSADKRHSNSTRSSKNQKGNIVAKR